MKPLLSQENELDPERLFFSSIKSKATKYHYTIYLQKFMEFVNCKTINGLIYDFKGSDSKDIERRLIEYVVRMKEEEGKNYSFHS